MDELAAERRVSHSARDERSEEETSTHGDLLLGVLTRHLGGKLDARSSSANNEEVGRRLHVLLEGLERSPDVLLRT